MLALASAWLAAEFAYAAVQRAFIAGRGLRSAQLNRLVDLLFEPLNAEVVATVAVPFRARDIAHARHGGVYSPGSTVEIELSPTAGAHPPMRVQPVLRRVAFDTVARRPELAAVARWDAFALGAGGARIKGVLPRKPGMYVVEFVNPTRI